MFRETVLYFCAKKPCSSPKMCLLLLVIGAFAALVAQPTAASSAGMETVFEWNYLDYLWNSPAERQEAEKSGAYNYGSSLPMDVDVARGESKNDQYYSITVDECPKASSQCLIFPFICSDTLLQTAECSCRSSDRKGCPPPSAPSRTREDPRARSSGRTPTGRGSGATTATP